MIDITKEYLIPYSILRNVRNITGNECLVLLLLNGYGSMKIKKLKELIHSDVRNKNCMHDDTLKDVITKMTNNEGRKRLIYISKGETYNESRIRSAIRVSDGSGYMKVPSVAIQKYVDREISQKEFLIFITLVRNIKKDIETTLDRLGYDLGICPHDVAKGIRNLHKAECMQIEKSCNAGYGRNIYIIDGMDKSRVVKKNASKNDTGLIYIMKNCGYYKIGRAKKGSTRFLEYTRLPEEPEYIIKQNCKDYKKVEKELHLMFSDKRNRGGSCEWFTLNEEDLKNALDYIEEHKAS